MGMGQQKSAPLRRKVQCKSFLPGTFWCAAKAMSLRCAMSPPFEFCIQHIGRHGMTFLKGFPRCPYGVVGPFFELTGWARPALWGTQHPFGDMGFPERVNPPLSRALPVVVTRGVQRDVGVRQIMSQICRCPRNGLRVGYGDVVG